MDYFTKDTPPVYRPFKPFCLFRLDLTMNNSTQELPKRFLQCFSLYRTDDGYFRDTSLTVIHASMIPLIIGANLLLIFGIIKLKRNKFTSSQILFLTLFLSDLTIAVIQLPILLYIAWKRNLKTCFEIQMGFFAYIFPVCMSGTILDAISLDRYISVVHNKHHKRVVTNKSLAVTIILAILVSSMWPIIINRDLDITKLAKVCIAMSAYAGALLAIGAILNIALLRNIKQISQNSSIHKPLDSNLTRTITIILAAQVVTYLPVLIILNIAAYMLNNSTGNEVASKSGKNFLWTTILPQINAVANSLIYFTRNSRMRRYYYKLFTCGRKNKYLENAVSPVRRISFQGQPAS